MGIDDAKKITNKSHSIRALELAHAQQKKRRPNREHRYDAGQIPSESQVKTILTTLEC